MARSGISPASIASSPTLYDQVFGLSVDLTSAQVFESGDFDDSTTSKSSAELEVEVTRSVRCVDEDRRRSWTHGPFTFDLSSRRWRRASALTAVPKESPTENAFLSRSPSGRKALRAVKVKASPEASKADTCLEVWIDGSLVVRSSQSSALHEGIFKSSAGQPGGLCWSQDEEKVVYVAERKTNPPPSSYFKAQKKDSKVDEGEENAEQVNNAIGTQFDLRDDWGEKLLKTDRLALFELTVRTGEVRELKIRGCGTDFTPSSPVLVGGCKLDGNQEEEEEEEGLIFVSYSHRPRKLGLIYCAQRPCQLRRVSLAAASGRVEGEAAAESDVLTADDAVAFSPRLSRSGDKVAFLASSKPFDTHVGPLAIKILHLRSSSKAAEIQTLVAAASLDAAPSVYSRKEAEAGRESAPEETGVPFSWPGYWWPAGLPAECWGAGDEHLWLSSLWGSRSSTVIVSLKTGNVERLDPSSLFSRNPGPNSADPVGDASMTVLCSTSAACGGGALLCYSSPTNEGGIALALPSETSQSGWELFPAPKSFFGRQTVTSATTGSPDSGSTSPPLHGLQWRLVSTVPDDSTTRLPIEGILLLPANRAHPGLKEGAAHKQKSGLIVVPHGGPHSCTPTSFIPSYAYLAKQTQCAVLHVNYRGSIGFGAPDLNSLPGKIGSQDVADVVRLTRCALSAFSDHLDADRVAVVGGSHGGFLTGHLIGQHPDLFKVAGMRNPVCNIPSMAGTSDIPDWCAVEGLGIGTYDFNAPYTPATPDALAKMFAASPVAHLEQVKAPTILAIGEKDRRVPPSQGIEYFHALKSRGIPTRLLLYPEDSHPIDRPASEADHWINVAGWLVEHLPHQEQSS